MEWILLEALVALAAGLAIVWWTMSPARRRERAGKRKDADNANNAANTPDRGDGDA